MRKENIFLFFVLLSICFSAVALETKQLLPNPLPVYVKGPLRTLNPTAGFTRKWLPIDNSYTDEPACYIVCYSHSQDKSIYAVGSDVYVVSQIRVPGNDNGAGCVPLHYEGQVVSSIQAFKNLCNKTYPAACKNQCWGGSNSW